MEQAAHTSAGFDLAHTKTSPFFSPAEAGSSDEICYFVIARKFCATPWGKKDSAVYIYINDQQSFFIRIKTLFVEYTSTTMAHGTQNEGVVSPTKRKLLLEAGARSFQITSAR